MLFMRKRVALTIALFHVAGKVFIHLPLLTLQPFVTFLALLLFWIYWILVLLFLGTTGQSLQSGRMCLCETVKVVLALKLCCLSLLLIFLGIFRKPGPERGDRSDRVQADRSSAVPDLVPCCGPGVDQ